MRFNGDSHASARKKRKKRLKGFKFRTVMGRFYDDIMAAEASFCLIFHRLIVVSVLISFYCFRTLSVLSSFFLDSPFSNCVYDNVILSNSRFYLFRILSALTSFCLIVDDKIWRNTR